ncbi:MAG: hypothetical protein ACYC3X_17755 [Pirellulaceae bacterium]
MHDSPLAAVARARMQQIRCDIDRDVEDMVDSARSLIDWKHYVRTYPWMCLGTAVAVGFLLAPKRSAVRRPDLTTLAELARPGHLVAKPAPSALHGLIDAVLATATNIVVRKATTCVGQGIGRLLGVATDQSTPPVAGCAAGRASRSN